MTFDLGEPTVGIDSASIELSMTFAGEAGDVVTLLAISVHDSDLAAGNADFSRFTFEPDATSLAAWHVVETVEDQGVETLMLLDAGAVGLVPGGPQRLGELTVDLAGLAVGTIVSITLAGGEASVGFQTDAAGEVGGAPVHSFRRDESAGDAAFVHFGAGEPASFEVIPEPATAALLAVGWVLVGAVGRRHRSAGRNRRSARGLTDSQSWI